MTRGPAGPAEYTATIHLADGTPATLRATWDAARGRGTFAIADALGPWNQRVDLDAQEFADAMRALLGRRESGAVGEGE